MNTYPLGTSEYVSVTVTSDVSLSAQPVTVSLDRGATWLPATWQGSAGTTRTARTTSPVTFASTGLKTVLVKVTDTPEVPIIEAGRISVNG